MDSINGLLEKNDENLDLFICAHKNFIKYPQNNIYKVIHGEEIIDVPLDQFVDSGTEVSDLQYSLGEGGRIYWIWKNYNIKKYIGFCHYSRYFNFFNAVPNMDMVFSKYDVVVKKMVDLRVYHHNLYTQYCESHCYEDIDLIKQIIESIFPEYVECMNEVMNDYVFYPGNIFIMKREDFFKYCEFVFTILQKFCDIRGFKKMDDIYDYIESRKALYIANKPAEHTRKIEYQARMLGFLLERITNIFLRKNFNKILEE